MLVVHIPKATQHTVYCTILHTVQPFNKLTRGIKVDGIYIQNRFFIYVTLTHRGRVMHITFRKLGHNWGSAPSHYQKQSWSYVNYTPGIKFPWKVNKSITIFLQGNAYENILCQSLLKKYVFTHAIFHTYIYTIWIIQHFLLALSRLSLCSQTMPL